MRESRLTAAVLWLAFFAAPARAAPSALPVRALFVGIDHYTHSVENDPSPDVDPAFHDLQGAVADVRLMKATLRTAFHLDLDAGEPGPGKPCSTSNAASITLTDGCATRAAILTALETQIASSPPGGIVLFYYAGHGSTHPDSTDTRTSGDNDTIVPSDARAPGAEPNDILDVELKPRIDQAEARGVSVVTVFDSCHSGTATRDVAPAGRVRDAPPPPPSAPPQYPVPPAPLAPAASSPGAPKPYRVHMAAAGDTEEAHETTRDGEYHGIFTLALTDTLVQRKGATYLDIAQETRWRLEQSGHNPHLRLGKALKTAAQNSQEEGELTAAFLGARPDPVREYPARAAGRRTMILTLDEGTLSGVTMGSTFGVYASAQAAKDDPKAVLVRGVVSDAQPASATLTLSTPLKAPAPDDADPFLAASAGKDFWVREIAHDYGAQRLRVEIVGGEDTDRKHVTDALAALGGDNGYVQIVGDEPNFIVSLEGGNAEFQNADRETIYEAGPLADNAFAQRLGEVTSAAANYFALLALRNDNGRAWARVAVCPRDARPSACPPEGAPVTIGAGDVDMWLINKTADQDLYRYALFLDSRTFEIAVIDPPANGSDSALARSEQKKFFEGRYLRSGHGTVLVLLTKSPINVAALRQDPVRDVETAPGNDLERLLLYAGAGQRGDVVLRTGDWGALTADVTVTP
jgi:hypothetical protein